jgi:hypothetical protein
MKHFSKPDNQCLSGLEEQELRNSAIVCRQTGLSKPHFLHFFTRPTCCQTGLGGLNFLSGLLGRVTLDFTFSTFTLSPLSHFPIFDKKRI